MNYFKYTLLLLVTFVVLALPQTAIAQTNTRVYTPVSTFDFNGLTNCASGWSFDNADGASQLVCTGSAVRIQDVSGYTRKAGLMWRNGVFPDSGNVAIEVRFKYPSYAGYGTDAFKLHNGPYFGGRICNNGVAYVGDSDCPTLPSAEIAGSHGTAGNTATPQRNIKIISGPNTYGWSEANTLNISEWMVARMEFEASTGKWDIFSYPTDCVNGGVNPCNPNQPAYGSYVFSQRPSGIHIGHHIIMKPGWLPGPWTNVEVDYMKVWSWVVPTATPTPTPTIVPTLTPTPTTPPPFTIQGQVVLRTSGSSSCAIEASDTNWTSPSLNFNLNNGAVATISPGINPYFKFANVPYKNGNYLLTFANQPSGYSLVCGGINRSVPGNVGNQTVAPFILVQNRSPWWQSAYGDLHTPGTLLTNIPNTCMTSGCLPYLSLANPLKAPGVPITTTGSTITGSGFISQLSNSPVARSPMSYTLAQNREDYAYFAALVNLGPSTATELLNLDTLPTPTNQTGLYYLSGTQTITNPLNASGLLQKHAIIFVDGNLNINATISQLPSSGFLAFIVNGNINVNPSLGTPVAPNGTVDPMTEAHLEGVFVADQSLNTGTSNKLLVGEGIFVGWGGIQIGRDFQSEANNSNPAFLVRYRPQLLLNTPTILKNYQYAWKEVAPRLLPTP